MSYHWTLTRGVTISRAPRTTDHGPAPGTTPTTGQLFRLWPIFLAVMVLTLGEGSFAILIAPYLGSRGIDAGVIGGLVAVYGVASLLTRLWAGTAYTSRRGPFLVAGAALASALAFILIPTTGSPLPVALLVGLNGAGFAFGTTALMASVMERRPRQVPAGTLMGIYTGSLAVGYTAAGFVGGPVADAIGVAAAFRWVAAVATVASVVLFTALRHTAVTRVSESPRLGWRDRVAAFRTVPRWVWLGFTVTLYINLVSGVLFTFFPLHGLDIGLSLSEIGIVFGIHGIAAAVIRFISAPVFAAVNYRIVMTPAVLLSGAGVALLGPARGVVAVAVAWGAIGLARGLLRVSSAALVLDRAGRTEQARGAASSVYLSGLDLGKILGPLLGGIGAESIGIASTFVAVAIAFPAFYLVAAVVLQRPPRRPVDTPA